MRIFNLEKSFESFSLRWQKEVKFDKKIYGIIGSNGCGKTTLMKMLAGLETPDSGKVDYEGLTPKDITMIFRKPYMMHDTVYHNLIYPLTVRNIVPTTDKVAHYLELAGLSDKRNQYALSLSGGEQQKLSFVRALIFSPKVILIDEAFSNMDIESVAKFENYILESQKETPRTWVVISHQFSNIKRLCDYVFFMNKGTVEAEGSTSEILFSPENPSLQKYLHYHTS